MGTSQPTPNADSVVRTRTENGEVHRPNERHPETLAVPCSGPSFPLIGSSSVNPVPRAQGHQPAQAFGACRVFSVQTYGQWGTGLEGPDVSSGPFECVQGVRVREGCVTGRARRTASGAAFHLSFRGWLTLAAPPAAAVARSVQRPHACPCSATVFPGRWPERASLATRARLRFAPLRSPVGQRARVVRYCDRHQHHGNNFS